VTTHPNSSVSKPRSRTQWQRWPRQQGSDGNGSRDIVRWQWHGGRHCRIQAAAVAGGGRKDDFALEQGGSRGGWRKCNGGAT